MLETEDAFIGAAAHVQIESRIDLDMINFANGSAAIPAGEFGFWDIIEAHDRQALGHRDALLSGRG
ncbi:MAG: hypothetical protein ACK4P4_00775 [Allorhizobium sp.]